ncbi:glycosyltransferase, partial [Escherichia coli]|nr:glycosyltransferase [Escherichia coli]
IDHRKNIEGLIRAFAHLPKELQDTHQIAVVCSAQPENKHQLQQLAKKLGIRKERLVLTGYVPEDHLLVLYNICSLFVFPSWYEGFGLPALE